MSKNQRTGNRKQRKIGIKSNIPDLGYYFIVTDTEETEQNYIYGLRDSIPDEYRRRLIITVCKTKTANLVTEAAQLAALQPQYGEPWIIFDRDQVENFDKIIDAADKAGIKTGWSNPCIEIWFGAYFGKMPSYNDSVSCCKGFSLTFEKQTNQKYQKSDKQIYSKLCSYGSETDAVKLANDKLHQCIRSGAKKPSDMTPCTTVYKLVNEIKTKIQKYNK